MKQYLLKSLGESVPQIALGTVELGLPYGFGLDGELTMPSFEQASRLVHSAIDAGIRFIDTARAYGDSESILGRCLEGRYSELILSTKVGPLKLDGKTDAEIAAAIAASLENSLVALRTDRVDWVMLHSLTLEQLHQLPRYIEPLEKLRIQGKFRALGASIYNDALDAALNTPEFVCLQLAGSVIDRRPEAALTGASACRKDFIFRSVLLRGALTERYKALPSSMDPLRTAIAQLDHLAADAGIMLTELAYRYAAGFDGLMLVGTADIAELQQAIAYLERGPLGEDLCKQIQSMVCLEDQFVNPALWPTPKKQTTATSVSGATNANR